MPTNQSSPWDGAKLRARCNADSPPAAICVGTHAAETVVAMKVPFGQTSLEPAGRKDRAKPVVSSASPSRRPKTAALTNAHSQFTAVPDGSPNSPRQLNGTPNPHRVPKPAGGRLTEPRAPSSTPKKKRPVGFNVQQRRTPQPGSGVATSGRPATTGGAPLLSSVCHRDPIIIIDGQTNKSMPEAADRSSSPSVPPLCLTVCDHQGAASRKDSSDETRRSTTTTATRRSQSAKAPKCSRERDGRTTTTAPNNPPVGRGVPPATTNGHARTSASPDPGSRRPPGSTAASACRGISLPDASPSPNVPTPTLLSANVSATPQGAVTAVTSVTSQISAIYLTSQGPPASSSSPVSSSPSPTEDGLVGETRLSGQDCVLQVDGVEEELPGELENACSDDDDSDCSSINGSSSTASITPLSGVEETMSLGAEDEREERPALVPSLFASIAPTLYFSTADEKVELLPADQRRLLRWKISTVTPNIVKHTIGRSHFKVTKKSHDWLGCWGHHMKSPCFKALGEHQKLNHFPGTFQIGRKDRLWRNLSKMQLCFGKREFGFFPRTFVLPQDIKLLRKAWEDGGSRQKWIIKPPASARGIGIQVIHKWGQMPRKRPLLVQKYLHKPYLISGNKFDLRIYVYVTCYDPLRIYIFSDGLVRFASCKYSSSMKTLGNKFMHLTNYSVNKKNSEYQTNSDDKACQGHKWTLKSLWQFLGSKGVNTTLIWEKIKDIVIKTIIGSEPYVNSLLKMHVRAPYSCHELFGFDIMLDEKLKPWILEVNISPSLHSNTALDVAVKGQMIRDLLNLAGFRIPEKEDVVAPCSSASSSTSSLCVGTRERTKPVSADEKVKRAFYLARRYADQDFLSTALDVLTPEDVRVLAESEDELTRLGQFERIFPSPASSRYLRFFECPRYLNVLLDQWEQKYCGSRAKGIGLLTSLCEKGVHLGTSDPLHTWSKSSYISSFEPHKENLVGPSRSRVVVTHQHRSHPDDSDEGSDTETASVSSSPTSPSPGSSGTSSARASPQPGLALSLLPQQFASL
ncbi:tubulin polyglutamylase TTLL4 [Cyclopterus lumpus]|uniref:tubulin polyglutamylase TTLL4 n=1 Tax=Cyclopterus lumpus TaxID=8103 RepID=UPI00148729EB|nr:tubulin polyglutamylase TTLL4 [Cyclopterus lumpus]